MSEKNKRPSFQKFKAADVDVPLQTFVTQVASDINQNWREVVAVEYLSVRSAPNSAAPVLLYLTRGRKYMVEISGKPWLKVKHPKLGERIGYVSATILNEQPEKK